MSSNKADLAAFLSRALIEKVKSLSQEYELVVAGGFENILDAWSSFGRPVDGLKSTHAEADTRLILHAEDAYRHGFDRCVLQCKDTDVLVLALGFHDKLSPELWLSTGSSSKQLFIPVHSINLDNTTAKNIIAFHTMTGCDIVSQFADKGKKTVWKVFQEMSDSLCLLGASTVSPEAILEAERFVGRLYMKTAECTSVNEARQRIFIQGKKFLEALPPTKDALDKHIQMANYQCFVWKESLTPIPDLPCPTACGWKLDGGKFLPELMTLAPVPKACVELVICSCRSGCEKRCGCFRGGQSCISACSCQGDCTNSSHDYDDNNM